MSTFAKRFLEALRDKGIGQSEFARRVDMSRSNATHWANGRAKNITAQLLDRGAAELGVNVAWLLRGEGPKRPKAMVGEPTARYILESTEEINGMELTKAAIEVARAFMALPENERDDFKQTIETAALKHKRRVPDSALAHLAAPPKETVDDDKPLKGKKRSPGTQ